ncbi:hypothetical protein TRIATDRAFT_320456 [Trichoderma atroviride IMI 206040]|uniref:Uncharacterized protein n=1 Tax=Hypocrea atroviridis (strain ATCC 20476 / IMI 206040) TaxID=452589 RepID=G9P0G0_HYPAI|nr:uncharacterized protein TRIATDRAFT_320456 [Trichoderma atroviride IMI 206040]EHK43151.1 hypothetical protein TRIATDRAFT_320456 [Trichoderma atroviride IMI 206040]
MAKRKSNDESPALPRKKAKLQQAPPNVLDAQATCLPTSTSMPAESRPSQREKRKRTRSPSPEPSAKRARTQGPGVSDSSVGSPEVWPRSPSNGVEYDSDEGITDHMRECEAKLLTIMSGDDPAYYPPSDVEDELEAEGRHTPQYGSGSEYESECDSDEEINGHTKECVEKLLAITNGNDPTYLPPSDVEDELEAEGRHTPERPYQHPRGRLLSPELLGKERLPPPFFRLSAREAIASLSPQERWRPPSAAQPLREKSRSPLQEARQSPPQNKSPKRQKSPRRQPEAHKKRINTGDQRRPRKVKPAPRVVEQILRSRRSSRRDGASQLWCLGDDGAPCLMISRR